MKIFLLLVLGFFCLIRTGLAQTKADWVPIVAVQATTIPSTYAPTPQFAENKALRYLRFHNTANCVVFISFGNDLDHLSMAATGVNINSTLEINLNTNNLYLGSTIKVRGNSCTSGTLFIQGAF